MSTAETKSKTEKAAEAHTNGAEAQEPTLKEPVVVRPMQFGPVTAVQTDDSVANLDLLMDVRVRVAVELGRANMSIRQVLGLTRGSVVELDKLAGEAVDVYVNDTMIARGEVVVVGEKFGVRVTDVIPSSQTLNLGAIH